MCKIKSKHTHTTVGITTTLNHISYFVRFLEFQMPYRCSVQGASTTSKQPSEFCKQRYYILHQAGTELITPCILHLPRQDTNYPCCHFLHSSPQHIIANAGIVLHTKLNLCHHCNSFCH